MKNAKVKWKLSIIQSARLKFWVVRGSGWGPTGFGKSSRIFSFFVHGLLVYSVSSAPFIIHISAVYRAGVTAITGITSMLDRSQARPSEETVCEPLRRFVCERCTDMHVYVWVSPSNNRRIAEYIKEGLSHHVPSLHIPIDFTPLV